MEQSPRSHLPLPVALVLLFCVYAVGLLLSLAPGASSSTWWVEVGVSATFLVLTERRHWAAILVLNTAVYLGVHLLRGDTVTSLQVLVQAAEPLVAALVLGAGHPGTRLLDTLGDFLRHLAASASAGTVGLLGGLGAALDGVGGMPGGEAVADFGIVTASTLIGTTAAAQLLLDPTLGIRQIPRRPGLALQSALTMGVVVVVFGPGQTLPIAFVPLPLLIWGAARYGLSTACWQVAAAASLSTYAAGRSWGPFVGAAGDAGGLPMTSILSNTWNLAATCVVLPIAIAVREQRRLTARLRADEELFRRSFSEALVGMVFAHREGDRLVIDEINSAGSRMLGRAEEGLIGLDLSLALSGPAPGGGGPVADLPLDDLLEGRLDSWVGHGSATARGGSRLHVSVSALTAAGRPRFTAQLVDMTLEQEARRALETSEQLTSATLDTAACLILVTDIDGTVVRVNAATEWISGYAEADLLGSLIWDTPISPFTESDVLALFLWPDRSGAAVTREHLARRQDGSPLRLVWNSSTVRDEHGVPAYAVLTGIDVTRERSTASVMTHVLEASVSTVLVGIDPVGRITLFNSGAEHLLGHRAASVIGQPFVSLLDPAELAARTGAGGAWNAFGSLVARLDEDADEVARDWTWVDQLDQRVVVSMDLSVTRDDLSGRVGYLCVARDVTAERRRQEALSSALDEERTVVERLRALDQAKDEFVSTVSHELRTPVTSIVGYTEMLLDGTVGEPGPEQRPMLDIVARNGERLIDICGDLLMLSGVDSGSAVFEPVPVDLAACLDSAQETAGGLSEGRDLAVVFTAPGHEVLVNGERSQLERVLVNLVSNAVKFTGDGGRVTVGLRSEAAEAVLEVCDTGIGIAAADQAQVFERFFRTTHARGRAIPGTGLGLAIVRTIVETHGGRIALSSRLGRGTVFTVTLPLLKEPAATASRGLRRASGSRRSARPAARR